MRSKVSLSIFYGPGAWTKKSEFFLSLSQYYFYKGLQIHSAKVRPRLKGSLV